MNYLRCLALCTAVFCLNGCVRGREERLPDEQAGDAQIFADKRRDVEARLNDKLAGIEARYQRLKINATPGSAVRPEAASALEEGAQAASIARVQLQQLSGSDRNGWEALRAQTEDTIKRAEEIWIGLERTTRR